jgi:hypothetical protein
MQKNIKSVLFSIVVSVICLVSINNIQAAAPKSERDNINLNKDKLVLNVSADQIKSYGPTNLINDLVESPNFIQRNITVWATGLPNKGQRKNIYRLERGVRYKVRVSRFTHFGTWQPTRRALKNDACYEFNARSNKVSLPVVKTNYGFNFCSGGYKANHVYESQVLYGRGTQLVMWVYDSDYRDNYGDYYIEVIEIRSRR